MYYMTHHSLQSYCMTAEHGSLVLVTACFPSLGDLIVEPRRALTSDNSYSLSRHAVSSRGTPSPTAIGIQILTGPFLCNVSPCEPHFEIRHPQRNVHVTRQIKLVFNTFVEGKSMWLAGGAGPQDHPGQDVAQAEACLGEVGGVGGTHSQTHRVHHLRRN